MVLSFGSCQSSSYSDFPSQRWGVSKQMWSYGHFIALSHRSIHCSSFQKPLPVCLNSPLWHWVHRLYHFDIEFTEFTTLTLSLPSLPLWQWVRRVSSPSLTLSLPLDICSLPIPGFSVRTWTRDPDLPRLQNNEGVLTLLATSHTSVVLV